MKSIESIIQIAFNATKQDLFEFICKNYGEEDPDLSVKKLNELFPTDQIEFTNDKFTESKGRGRPRKGSTQS